VFQFPAEASNFPSLQSIWTGYRAHLASCSVGIRIKASKVRCERNREREDDKRCTSMYSLQIQTVDKKSENLLYSPDNV
jgi:hypothetical protein